MCTGPEISLSVCTGPEISLSVCSEQERSRVCAVGRRDLECVQWAGEISSVCTGHEISLSVCILSVCSG